MANPWFRFYTEALDDDKLRLLAFEDRWHFVSLLCLKGNGLLDDDCSKELLLRRVAVKMGLSVRELEEVARRLAEVELIDKETLQPLKWEARQFASDSSSDRVKQYRDRKKQEKQACNVDETLQQRSSNVLDTDTDTDTDTELKPNVPTVHSRNASLSDLSPPVVEAKEKIDKPERLPCPVKKIIEVYHEKLPVLPTVAVLTKTREAHAKTRWQEVIRNDEIKSVEEGVAFFSNFFEHVGTSKFLTGQINGKHGAPPFKADFEWLMKPNNFAKILEGKYHR